MDPESFVEPKWCVDALNLDNRKSRRVCCQLWSVVCNLERQRDVVAHATLPEIKLTDYKLSSMKSTGAWFSCCQRAFFYYKSHVIVIKWGDTLFVLPSISFLRLLFDLCVFLYIRSGKKRQQANVRQTADNSFCCVEYHRFHVMFTHKIHFKQIEFWFKLKDESKTNQTTRAHEQQINKTLQLKRNCAQRKGITHGVTKQKRWVAQ